MIPTFKFRLILPNKSSIPIFHASQKFSFILTFARYQRAKPMKTIFKESALIQTRSTWFKIPHQCSINPLPKLIRSFKHIILTNLLPHPMRLIILKFSLIGYGALTIPTLSISFKVFNCSLVVISIGSDHSTFSLSEILIAAASQVAPIGQQKTPKTVNFPALHSKCFTFHSPW